MMDILAGRLPAETDTRTLQMSQYAKYFEMDGTDPPRSFGLGVDGAFHDGGNSVPYPVDDTLGNDEFQACIPAAMARLAQAWSALAGKEDTPTREQSLAIYETISAFRLVPDHDGAKIDADQGHKVSARRRLHNDYGASLLSALKLWVSPDHPLGVHLPKADAFMEVEPGDQYQVRDAIRRFGGVIVGLALPRSILGADGLPQERWSLPGYGAISDATPGSLASHCVTLTGYTPSQFLCASGGRLHSLSWPFLLAYVQECYVVQPLGFAAQRPELLDRIRADISAVRAADRPDGMPALDHRWRGGNIM